MAPCGRRSARIIAAFSVLGALCIEGPAHAVAGTEPGGPIRDTDEPQIVTRKGRVSSDGTVMVGLPEAIAVAKFPPRAKLVITVTPARGVNQCFVGDFFCAGDPVNRAPSSPPLRTSGKGRALVQIYAPDQYVRQRPGHPQERFDFQTGSAVLIEAFASSRDRKHDRLVVGFASSKATITQPTQ